MRKLKSCKERFEAKFTKGAGCWEWTACKDPYGYGAFILSGRQEGAHRVAYQFYVGEIPEGMCVCHHCDNPACVRPDHLFLGTQTDNVHDCNNKGRRALPFGEKHYRTEFTATQVIEIRARRAAGERGAALAREFGVGNSAIYHIVHRHSWAWL